MSSSGPHGMIGTHIMLATENILNEYTANNQSFRCISGSFNVIYTSSSKNKKPCRIHLVLCNAFFNLPWHIHIRRKVDTLIPTLSNTTLH